MLVRAQYFKHSNSLTSPRKVHVSSCGKHLAILTLSNKIILVQGFWRLVPVLTSSSSTSVLSPLSFGNISKQVEFHSQPPLRTTEGCLAYDRGKVALVSVHGIYVLVLDSILDQWGDIDFPQKDVSLQTLLRSSEHRLPWPSLRLREVKFGDVEIPGRRVVLCLRLTETKLYFTVFPNDIAEERGGNMWCYDFT